MKKTCKKCGKVVERHTTRYCRPCYEELGRKKIRPCANCGNPLSKTSSWQGSIHCRECHWKLYPRRHKTYLNKQWLIEHHVNKKLSLSECAKLSGCGSTTLNIWLQRFGIIPMTESTKKKILREQKQPAFRRTMNRGYTYLYIGNSGRGYKVPEHKWFMEQHLGRQLTPKERIHHLNGIKTDNRLENLMLFSNDSEHQTFERKVSFFAKQILYGELHPELRDNLKQLFTEFLLKFE